MSPWQPLLGPLSWCTISILNNQNYNSFPWFCEFVLPIAKIPLLSQKWVWVWMSALVRSGRAGAIAANPAYPSGTNLIKHWSIVAQRQWCHNEHHGISNHWQLNCLFKFLFRLTSKKSSKPTSLTLCEGNPLDSPHKGPVMSWGHISMVCGWHYSCTLRCLTTKSFPPKPGNAIGFPNTMFTH